MKWEPHSVLGQNNAVKLKREELLLLFLRRNIGTLIVHLLSLQRRQAIERKFRFQYMSNIPLKYSCTLRTFSSAGTSHVVLSLQFILGYPRF